jgi:hypothetical protein
MKLSQSSGRTCRTTSTNFQTQSHIQTTRDFGIGIDVSICIRYVTADHTNDYCKKVGWMPRATWAIVLCAVVMGLGCEKFFTSPDRPVTPSIARSLAPAIPADSLIVEYVLLERPIGDVFLDRDLWTSTLPAGSPEIRSLLAENGIRAGILTGMLPTQFQTMLETKADVVDHPHLITFSNRKETVIPTAGPIEACEFDILSDLAGKSESVSLKEARCGVLVRPQSLGEGRVKVWCEPQIQHGSRQDRFRPSEDGTQFTKYEEVPTEKYSAFGFEVTLRPEECLVIGCIADQQETLGAVLFGVEANGHPRQRIVAIRARVVNSSPTADLPAIALPGRRPTQAPVEK